MRVYVRRVAGGQRNAEPGYCGQAASGLMQRSLGTPRRPGPLTGVPARVQNFRGPTIDGGLIRGPRVGLHPDEALRSVSGSSGGKGRAVLVSVAANSGAGGDPSSGRDPANRADCRVPQLVRPKVRRGVVWTSGGRESMALDSPADGPAHDVAQRGTSHLWKMILTLYLMGSPSRGQAGSRLPSICGRGNLLTLLGP